MKKKYGVFDNYLYILPKYYKHNPKYIYSIFGYLIVSVCVPISSVLVPTLIIKGIENNIDLLPLILLCLITFSIHGVLCFVKDYINQYISVETDHLRNMLFDVSLLFQNYTLDYQIYDSPTTKNHMRDAGSALWRGASWGPSGFITHSIYTLENILNLVVYCFMIGTLNIWLVLFLLTLSIIRFIAYRLAIKYDTTLYHSVTTKIYKYLFYLNNLSSSTQSAKDVRLYNQQNWIFPIIQRKTKELNKSFQKEGLHYFYSDLVGLILDTLRDGACYIYVFYQLTKGMPISSLIFYINMVQGFSQWTMNIADYASKILRDSKRVKDYRSYIDLEKESYSFIDESQLVQPWSIEFKDVCFSYDNNHEMILDHFNFKIRAKEKLAIVGLNGAGKTTLIKLICGLLHPTSGEILINGINIETISRDILHNHISTVFQETELFYLTIKENIILGGTYDEQKYNDILEKANIKSLIESLPYKSDTGIGKAGHQDGIYLSGGQTQKVLIARAIYKDSQLLILDEPTSALDAIAENEIYEQYHQLSENKTSIFISHRLASTRFLNRIIFFENGKIIEEGTHDELMALNGKYKHIFDVQSQYYQEEGEQNEKQL